MNLGRDSYCFTEGIRDSIKVGNYSTIAADCVFHEPNDHHLVKYNHNCVYTDMNSQPQDKPEIEIGNDVWIGRGAKILPGIKIADGAIIGAWSVVTKDVPAYAVVAGNPAIIRRFRFNGTLVNKLLDLKWWEWDGDKVAKARETMKDINEFLKEYS